MGIPCHSQAQRIPLQKRFVRLKDDSSDFDGGASSCHYATPASPSSVAVADESVWMCCGDMVLCCLGWIEARSGELVFGEATILRVTLSWQALLENLAWGSKRNGLKLWEDLGN